MKALRIFIFLVFSSMIVWGQAGHIMQGVGAVNMSMGGAATGQPLDISGALQWNPAAISAFDHSIVKLDVGLFFSSPKLKSTAPDGNGGFISGSTMDDRGTSLLPALGYVRASAESKHSFGISAFGISGFGVTFPQETNLPMDAGGNPNPNFDPNNSNPITWPQNMQGFGRIESNYQLLQVSLTYAYEVSDQISIGIQPNFNYSSLELMPNPTANPSQTAGYPTVDATTALGFGAQIGVFYDGGSGFKAGASYKTKQQFQDFDFDNEYLDGSSSSSSFSMDYPAILSLGLGYSIDDFDVATDYRQVFYERTNGFNETGWTPTASVLGFGWQNISILSAGVQYKGIEKLPIRVGYTYSTNPIPSNVAFFNVPATAIIKNAFQIGFSYMISDKFQVDGLYHHGTSSGNTSGQLLNPQAIQPTNPLGQVPGSEVSYEMTTDMIGLGLSYHF